MYVFSSENSQLERKKFRQIFNYSRGVTDKFIDPHMKLMLVDRKKLFFGTGNFSANAFNDAREIYALTKDKNAIDVILSIAYSYIKFFKLDNSFTSPNTLPKENWVIMNPKHSNITRVLPHTEKSSKPWLSSFRKVKNKISSKLSLCGFDKALFISEKDYLACIS